MADPSSPTSFLLVEEHFARADARFLPALLGCADDRGLAALAPRWFRDVRPWARSMLLAYVDDGCDRPRHRVLVKALLKLAEEGGDDELLGHFLRAFDRLVRHEVRELRTYRGNIRVLRPTYPPRRLRDPYHRVPNYRGKLEFVAARFSGATRLYLRRRAFRYFRVLARRDPSRFVAAAIAALALYRESDVAKPEYLLDTYGLTNLLFYGEHGRAFVRDARRITLAMPIAEWSPAPLAPNAWRGRLDALLDLLGRADALVVRRFVVRWLEREEQDALRALDARRLVPLLSSPYPDVRLFAIHVFERAQGLGTLAIATWLALLALDDVEVLSVVCRAVERHVDPKRLGNDALVALATSAAAPVAALGLRWLRERPIDAAALTTVIALTEARAASVRASAAQWLIELVRGPLGSAERLRDLIDARYPEFRRPALAAWVDEPRFADDPALWAAASESPYPDVIAVLVTHLEARAKTLAPERLEHLWARTLLAVHGGSRSKRVVLRQIADRIVARPADADDLLPILRIALRSVREAERRAALAAVCTAAFEAPALRTAIAKHLPELTLFPEAVSA